MKNSLLISVALLFCTALLSFNEANAQASLQIIHNSADPTLAALDLYIDGSATSNVYYSTATGYKSVSAGVTINIGVAYAGSGSVNDTIKNFPVVLNNNETYIAMICGVVNPLNFAANPQALQTSLQLILKSGVRKSPTDPSKTEFMFFQGVTDFDSKDVLARLNGNQFNDKSYGDTSGYNTLTPADFTFDITPFNDNFQLQYTFDVDFSAYTGYALALFTSGFDNPSANQNGPGVALFGVDSNGSVVQFSSTLRARFQAIHNCADPLLDSIDIYMFGVPVLSDFKFRTATTFLDVPAGVPLKIGVAPGNSLSEADTIKSFNLIFQNGKTYVGFASGLVNPGLFAPNPKIGRAHV